MFEICCIENKLRPSSPCFARSFPPQGEALTKARITLFAEKNFVSKILCRQEGKAKKILLFIGEGVAVPDGVDLAGIVRVQVFAV